MKQENLNWTLLSVSSNVWKVQLTETRRRILEYYLEVIRLHSCVQTSPTITRHGLLLHQQLWMLATRLSNMELLEMEIHHLTFQTITLSSLRADNIFQRDRPQTSLCVVFHTTLLAAAWILLRPSDAPLWLWTCKWTTKIDTLKSDQWLTPSGIKPHSNVA